MIHGNFVHLRVHSPYSLAEGAIRMREIVDLCIKQRMPAVAITDTCNLFGALEFSEIVRKAGIQPIIGCQVCLKNSVSAISSIPTNKDINKLVLLVQNEAGYKNLSKLITDSYLSSESSENLAISLDELEKHNDGLIALSGGSEGPIGTLLIKKKFDESSNLTKSLLDIFKNRFYMELLRHGIASQRDTEEAFIDLAYKNNIPLVATNEVFFPDETMFEAHDALMCISDQRYVDEQDRKKVTLEHRFKSVEEMNEVFSDIPEAIDNTILIAQRCSFFPTPKKPMLPSFQTQSKNSEDDELRFTAREGLKERLKEPFYKEQVAQGKESINQYSERLEHELKIIINMGFSGYFLIVADFIKWAKKEQIPVGPGRGSGAGSLVAWVLTITDLDPLRFGLLFERFLNPERVSMPDFDIDFCQERRDEVIQYVQNKYGSDRVAQIITFGTLQARAALRDVGRVLQIPYGKVDRICKLVPFDPARPITLVDAQKKIDEIKRAISEDSLVKKMFNIASKLEGLYRHASTHAAGIVIGDRPLHELVPLYRDPRSDIPATQFSMKHSEAMGLVKFDFLGLKTLTVIRRALELIKANGKDIDILSIPLDDKKTFKMLAEAKTIGVFQLESTGMRDVLAGVKPDRFEDIVAVVALFRPGPMENIPSYISRKHGVNKPDYMDDKLENVLKETYGIMIYQEQVMQIAQILSGFSPGKADLLRRAMGKKIKSEMDAQRSSFIDGAISRGTDQKKAQHIFDQIEKFAGYGFNKSHAAAYAMVAYQTGYLKANHPVEFLAATMTMDINNTDKINVFREDAGNLKIKIFPPDINCSDAVFSVERENSNDIGSIRFALGAIKNVGIASMKTVVLERNKNGRYKSIFDFARRHDTSVVNKKLIESLVCAGAFDSIDSNRALIFHNIERMIQISSKNSKENKAQEDLFGNEDNEQDNAKVSLSKENLWDDKEKLQREFESLGFYLSAHPLSNFSTVLSSLNVSSISSVEESLSKKGSPIAVTMAGTVVTKKERVSQKGSRYAFVKFSDLSGEFEATVFSDLLSNSRDILEDGNPVLIIGKAEVDGEFTKILAQKLSSLEHVMDNKPTNYTITLDNPVKLEDIENFLKTHEGGQDKITIKTNVDKRGKANTVNINLNGNYNLSPSLINKLKSIPGISNVESNFVSL